MKKLRVLRTRELKVHEPFKNKALKDANVVADTLLDCIRDNDLDAFREVLAAHLLTVNKKELAKKAGIGRRTIYDLINPDKEFNPELTTVSALINTLAA